jgi:hypothetical protein
MSGIRSYRPTRSEKGSSLGAQHPAARSAAGQARQSSEPTPASGGTVRRRQGLTAAVAIGGCRLRDKPGADWRVGRPPLVQAGRREWAAARSRLSTRAQRMEASVETSATVADARGAVRAAPWRRAALSTDAAASWRLVMEGRSDREDRGVGSRKRPRGAMVEAFPSDGVGRTLRAECAPGPGQGRIPVGRSPDRAPAGSRARSTGRLRAAARSRTRRRGSPVRRRRRRCWGSPAPRSRRWSSRPGRGPGACRTTPASPGSPHFSPPTASSPGSPGGSARPTGRWRAGGRPRCCCGSRRTSP